MAVRFDSAAFSATRISEDLLLSAAHCIVGFDGEQQRGPFYLERGGNKISLAIAEIGDYRGTRGHMSDWGLLRADDPASLAGVAIADFPDRAEMDAHLREQAASLDGCGLAIWTIGYPAPSLRRHPRPPIPGRLEVFLSRGLLKSHAAYRELAALALAENVLYDQQFDPPLPPRALDVDGVWRSFADHQLVQVYEDYAASGDPILYHSGDYSRGSSGGGVFVEDSGDLLGLIPMGSSIQPDPRNGWPGFGQAYRVDRVCAESKILAALDKCRRLRPQTAAAAR